MDSPGALSRRRGTTKASAEDQALDQIAKEVRNMSCKMRKKISSHLISSNNNLKSSGFYTFPIFFILQTH